MALRPDIDDSDHFVFRKHDDIGTAAAEDDSQYLEQCFIDTGDLAQLADCRNPRRIIVGRTGSGKSALVSQLTKKCRNVIYLSPQSLSLNFIANSSIINFFETAGVNLSAFYGLLWRHILVVELLKKKYNIVNEESHRHYQTAIRSLLYKKDKTKELAVEYLEQWGEKFWLTTEDRIHQLTEKIETNLSSWMGDNLKDVDVSGRSGPTI